jgi:hypothetical protein
MLRSIKIVFFSALAISTIVALAGCEKSEDKAIASAQACLDKATGSAAANACLEKINGYTSQKAYLVRCSANFVAQGFTGQRLADAFQSIKSSGSGGGSTNSMTSALGYFTFGSTAAMTEAATNCEKSGVRSMQRLATMANLATTLADLTNNLGAISAALAAGSDPTAAIQAAIAAIPSVADPEAAKASLGNIAVQANTAFCNSGSSFTSNDVCKTLSSALAAGTPSDVGALLLTCLSNPAAAGCH